MSPVIDFEAFTRMLHRRLQAPLPGPLAHEPMKATPVGSIRPDFLHKVPPRPGSVLLLIYPQEARIKIPLTKRADYVGAHSGQISLPGGKREPGEDEDTNALRESEEEIGLDRNKVVILGHLSNFFVIPSNYLVTPVVGMCTARPEMRADDFETVRIVTCDLFDLIADEAVQRKEILAAGRYRMMAPHFNVEGEIVWGATAMMLNEFRMICREILGSGAEE